MINQAAPHSAGCHSTPRAASLVEKNYLDSGGLQLMGRDESGYSGADDHTPLFHNDCISLIGWGV
jgi:hypothetical protein